MTDVFHDTANIDFPIIDADAHVNEPPELWQERVPSKWRDRAPRCERRDGGDVWVFDDGAEHWPVGLTACAGLSFFEFKAFGNTYETMRPGSFETDARLEDMDADGIHTQVLYPSVTLKGAKVYGSERELQVACVRAYNEWLLEFCSGSAGRLIPQAILPSTCLEDTVNELEWAMKNGHKGAVISAFPNGSLDPQREDDAFWARAHEADFPIALHIGSFLRHAPSGTVPSQWSSLRFCGRAAWTKAGGETLDITCEVLFSGIFDRFPQLKILLVEANIGWIPTLLEQADDMFRRYRWYTGAHKEMRDMPSEVFQRNFWATFMIDTVGIEQRHRMNIDHIMWSSDYPHSGSDWPDSRITIERQMRGLPMAEVKKMLCTNAVGLYNLDVPALRPGW
jgi:predicted TIM-barrel fold metal-dependent hydrolase